MHRGIRTAVLLGALALVQSPASKADAPAAPAAAPVDAVWVELERNFAYFGRTTYYSCDSLRDKVRYVLQQAGARPDLKVSVSCADSGGVGIESMPNVRIKAAFPAEATPERLAKIAAEAPRRELVARVKGEDDQGAAPFPAAWGRVEFDGRSRGRVEDGDCELLEQMLKQVLVPAGARVAPESRLSCVPGQVPLGSVRLVVDTLQKAPEPDVAPGETTSQSSSGRPPVRLGT